MPLFNTTPTTDIIKLHHTSNLNKHSTVHFAQTVECLQEKYIEIFEMMCMPLYEELKGGELFRVIQHIQYGYWSDETKVLTWDDVQIGQHIMYISKRIDDKTKLLPKWIIGSEVREIFIPANKLLLLTS